eukprot:1444912-Pyramimonas_sp.AAC.1
MARRRDRRAAEAPSPCGPHPPALPFPPLRCPAVVARSCSCKGREGGGFGALPDCQREDRGV